jgi:hypothetical protein
VKLTQPASDPAAGISSCQKLDGGAMRPPGVWDGGVRALACACACACVSVRVGVTCRVCAAGV